MKFITIIVLVGIAAGAGYLLGTFRRERHETPLSRSRVTQPDRAAVNNSSVDNDPVTGVIPERASKLPTRQDPRAAAQEELEAMRHGDVETVSRSIVLTAAAKERIASALASVPPELRSKYPTPEMLAAFVFCGAQRIDGFRIQSTTFEHSDHATQQIAYKFASEPEWRTEDIAFTRTRDGWCRVIDVGLAERVVAIVGIRKE